MWVEFVVGFRPCSERFFLGTPISPSSSSSQIYTSFLITILHVVCVLNLLHITLVSYHLYALTNF